MSRQVHVLNGPNLNLLGQREPHLYGSRTLADVEALCRAAAGRHGFDLDFRQTNREFEMIDWIQATRKDAGLVINPAGFSHFSAPVLDALKMCECPVVEVHISNLYKREEFRHKSILSKSCVGMIAGLGLTGYALAIQYFLINPSR